MKKSTQHSELILNLNSRLFINALEDVTEEQAAERISNHNNPINWMATHTVWARFNMLALLGKPVPNPYQGMFEDSKPYDSNETYPALEDVKTEWRRATALLGTALSDVSEEHLNAEAPMKNPTGDFSFGSTIAFLTQHESYTIGQLAFMKKYTTKEAMKY